ncbi:hypothetical protein BJ944DRAFT_269493 [Cunninghamella echinulata]|nr:hypothetical protein BJ944DRAFT_269493 [Cunninghamella echinulata]
MNFSTPSFYTILHSPPLLDTTDIRLSYIFDSIYHTNNNKNNEIYMQKVKELDNLLNQEQYINSLSLQILFNELIQNETKFKCRGFKKIILKYLFKHIMNKKWILLFIKTNCIDMINDEEEVDRINFIKSFYKMKSTIGYKGLEEYHILYDIQKDLQLPSCVWREILVSCQDKQTTKISDGLINQLLNYPFQQRNITDQWLKLFPSMIHIPNPIQTGLKLHSATHSMEMNYFIQTLISKGYNFKPLSSSLISIIHEASIQPVLLELESQIETLIENSLMHGNEKEMLTICFPFWLQGLSKRVDETLSLPGEINKDNSNELKDLLNFIYCYILFYSSHQQYHYSLDMSFFEKELQCIWKAYSFDRSFLFNDDEDEDALSLMIEKLLSILFSLHSK